MNLAPNLGRTLASEFPLPGCQKNGKIFRFEGYYGIRTRDHLYLEPLFASVMPHWVLPERGILPLDEATSL